MASEVDICNVALGYIGADATITAISPPDGTFEASKCAVFYPIARTELIEQGSYSFTLARAVLTPVANPSTVWTYAYAAPSDLVNARRILQLAYLNEIGLNFPIGSLSGYYLNLQLIDDLFTERGSSDFAIEGDTLLTNEPDAVLMYCKDVTDTSKFSPLFVAALGAQLAAYLAGPIIKGMEGAKIGLQYRAMADQLRAKAETSDANSANERGGHVAQHIRARS